MGTPLLPGTRAPGPVRVMAAPMIGGLLRSVVKPNAKMVVRLMSAMGEKETIGRYPDRIESMVAAGRDPIAAAADLAELRAGISLFGFRRSLRVQPAELRRLTVPTLLVWGDRDPVGGVEVANILVAPPVPFLPEAVHGKMVIDIIGVYAGPVEDGAQAAQPLRALAEPVADLMGPMPYTAMQSLLDPLWQPGAHNYFSGTMLGVLTDEAIEILLARHAAGRAPVHELHLHHGGGAMASAPAGGTAFAHRDAAYILNIIARSPDREGFDTHAGWARATYRAMEPWSTGGYVNFTSEPGQDKVQASYPPDTYARLVTVKDQYDPTNLFQLNQNIRPSGHR